MKQKIIRSAEIGQNIRTLRLSEGLTQEQMVAKLQLIEIDMTRGTYAKIEAGIRHISIEELHGIKYVLKAEWDDILKLKLLVLSG